MFYSIVSDERKNEGVGKHAGRRLRTPGQTESVGSGYRYFFTHVDTITDFGHVIEPVFTSSISSLNRFKRVCACSVVRKTRSVSDPVPIPGCALATLVVHKARSVRATFRAHWTRHSLP